MVKRCVCFTLIGTGLLAAGAATGLAWDEEEVSLVLSSRSCRFLGAQRQCRSLRTSNLPGALWNATGV